MPERTLGRRLGEQREGRSVRIKAVVGTENATEAVTRKTCSGVRQSRGEGWAKLALVGLLHLLHRTDNNQRLDPPRFKVRDSLL